jgi:tetratricopeptide (TPR) repeat protein
MTQNQPQGTTHATHDLAEQVAKRLTETLQAASPALRQQTAAGALARGQVFQIAGYLDDAAECYTEALALDPGLHEAAARLAVVEAAAGRAESALSVAMKLAAQAPSFEMREVSSEQQVSALTILGDALANAGRTADAVSAYELARKSNPKDTFAAARLAQMYLATGQHKKAVDQSTAFAANPRFRVLAKVLTLGSKSEALLPIFDARAVHNSLRVAMPGRPVLADGEPVVAPLVDADTGWCGEPSPE